MSNDHWEELNLPDPNRTVTHVIEMWFDNELANMYVYEDGDSLYRCIQLAYIAGHPRSVKDINGNDCSF
jgi:hypothetical protein